MNCIASATDIAFRDAFERGDIGPDDFHHRDHLRLAFVYLCNQDIEHATERVRHAIAAFLDRNGVPADKYHETITVSWMLAVRHFMHGAGDVESFDEFLEVDSTLLDTNIMLTHYNRETLFSEDARTAFVEPDIQDIPRY